MNTYDKIESLCERILSKLKSELNSHPISLIDITELKERITESIESEDNEESVFNSLYPVFYVSALDTLSADILSGDDSFMDKQSVDEVNVKSENIASDLLKNHLVDDLFSIPFITDQPSIYNENKTFVNNIKTEKVPALINGEKSIYLKELSDIICNLLPNTNRLSIDRKLKKHNYEGYKAVLLQECITNALEDGYEVSEPVFQKLEEWLNSPDMHKKSTKKHKSKVKVLNHNTNLVNSKSRTELTSENKDHDLIEAEYSGATANVPNSIEEERRSLSDVRFTQNEETDSFLLSFVEDEEGSKTLFQSNLVDVTNSENNFPNTVSTSNEFVQVSNSSQSSPNGSGHYEFEDIDKGCMIVDVVAKKNPFVVELDEEESCPGSAGSDVLLVEEVYSKHSTIAAREAELSKSPVQVNEVSTVFEKNDDDENIENYIEDIDADATPWNEAHSICELLPFFKLNSIHQSVMDNYYHPQRKVKVLTEYIEMALEEGHDIHTEVFEVLYLWQMNRKRHSSSDAENPSITYKKQKHTGIESPVLQKEYQPIPQPSTSTSHDSSSIPIEQPLPSTEDISDDAQMPFESFPEETKSWYLKKVDFLFEITNLDKKYILSQIIHCQTEADVMHVTTRLLEEQTMNILQQPPEANADLPILPVDSSQGVDAIDTTGDHDNTSEINRNLEENDSNPSTSTNDDANGNQASAADTEDRIQAHIQQLGEMFSDADPDFLSEKAYEVGGEHEKFVELVVELTENRSYPKMEEYLKRQQMMIMRKKFIEGMSVEEFMKYFEDPEKVFIDTTKEMSKMYVSNARLQLMNDLPFHLSRRIDFVFKVNNFHYLPTLRTLKKEKGARKSKRKNGKQPGDLDDIFLKELCYAKMEDKIKEHFKNKKKDRQLAFKKAKESCKLLECQCCFDDEFLQIDMSSCENMDSPHFFCNNCIKRYAEEQIGQGKMEFVCLQGECKHPFSLNTLKTLLKPSIFSNLLKRKQAEEIAAAGIEDLESCPFCNFATIMPNKEDKVFKCLNPECLKDSCRLCKELNHIPLRCQEVEKKKQTDARTFLENEMTEAMVRECYKCKKRFIKEEGCNKMICSCGAMMCYLCKNPIKGYDHFASDSRTKVKTNDNKCPLWSNSLQLHAEEVQQRAAEAKKKLGPDVDLLHDPTTDMPQVPDYLKKPRPNHNPIRGDLFQRDNAFHIQIQQLQQHLEDNVRNLNFPRMMAAELLVPRMDRIQRHTHQHRHHHFYVPLPNPHLPPPPPAHHPPPPPAHQRQQGPPFPPFMDDLNRGYQHQFRGEMFVLRPQPPPPPPIPNGRIVYPNPPNPHLYPPIQQVLAPPPPLRLKPPYLPQPAHLPQPPHPPPPAHPPRPTQPSQLAQSAYPSQPPHQHPHRLANNHEPNHHRQRNHNHNNTNQRHNQNHHHNHNHHHHRHHHHLNHNNNNNNNNNHHNNGNNHRDDY